MEVRAGLLLALLACAGAAKDCIELTLPEHTVISNTLLNGTVLRIFNNNSEYSDDRVKYNIFEVWNQFPKVLVPANGSSEQCRIDSQMYLDGLDKLQLWALKMFDATAKPPSGILSGNGNQYGDFDQCLGIDGAVQGKYCLASMEMTLEGDQDLDYLDYLLHSGHYIRSNLSDMGHRLPRYSSILWGVCIPSSCSSFDLEDEMSDRLAPLGINVKVHNTMCSVRDHKRPFSIGKTMSITFFLAIILLLTVGTIFDDNTDGTTTFEKLLNAFSLRRNFNKLLDTSETESRLKGLDTIRGLNAFCLVLVHKSMAMAHNSYINKTQLAEVFGMPWAVIGRSAIIYTDSFLYLSGFLNAHNLLMELQRKDTIDVKNRILARWFRLFPLFLSLMLFCTFILPDTNSGPQWNLVVQEHSRICEKNMWKSFLFIHNYFGFENMCLTHTHQIGMDMQLYIFTLPLMLVLWKSRSLGWTLAVGAAVISTLLRYVAVYWHDISMFVYYGISVQKLLDAAKYCYILPTHRATIYLMGVAMAFFLQSKSSKFILSQLQALILWTASIGLMIFTIVYPWTMGIPSYTFEPQPAAIFAAFSPVMWGLALAAAHWAMTNNHASKGERFINCRVFKLFNKIAYGVYLTQFPIFFYNVGVQRTSGYYSPFTLFDLPEMLTIVGISVLTTIAIEMPFNQVYRILFGKKQIKLKEK